MDDIKISIKTKDNIDLSHICSKVFIKDNADQINEIQIALDNEQLLLILHDYLTQDTKNILERKRRESIDYNNITYLVNKDTSNLSRQPDKNQQLYIDPRFIFVVDQKIIELIAIPNEESDLNNFKNKYKINAETWVRIKEIKNEFNDEKTKLEREKPNCPSCEIGALNRKYITKLLPYLENEAGNKFLEDLDTIFLKYNQEITDLESLKLNFSETKSLLKQMDEELKKQTKDGKTCSTCAMNSLKNKYLQLARSMYHIKINSLTNLK